jgi:hypothetical protein
LRFLAALCASSPQRVKLDIMSSAHCADRRWFRLTPGRLIAGLLLAECLFWLSNRLGWPAWHKGYAVLTGVASVGVVLAALFLWWLAALLFRWRFQFSLRSLLILTLTTAGVCSWFGSELKEAKRQQALIAAIVGWVHYDYEYDRNDRFLKNPQPTGPAWLRRIVTDDFLDAPVDIYLKRIPRASAVSCRPVDHAAPAPRSRQRRLFSGTVQGDMPSDKA